jgi:predicted  nucleic acid-binding Zn-ribbon protein
MVEITNELIYEVLKSMQTRLDRMNGALIEIKTELQAVRSHIAGMQQDISNIYVKLGDHDDRLERIETRLGLLEPAH